MDEHSSPFDKSADYYDMIYDASEKDYRKEAKRIHQLVRSYKKSKGKALLDVGCGTGRHIQSMWKYYSCEGLDIQPKLLSIARKRNPRTVPHRGNMLTFNLHKQFDAITCLFSAIGYMKTIRELNRAIKNMACHLNAGGVLIVEPWLIPESIIPGHLVCRLLLAKKHNLDRVKIGHLKHVHPIFPLNRLTATPH